jgi:hypothetical protein
VAIPIGASWPVTGRADEPNRWGCRQ